ncbi:hypothetical protein CLU81_4798 [Flavobacterium sp. 9]|uniref:hypothetical protein n=1 Tax=Flavobacterium sp. 9 TaxID=2035198 RepID=UPI000C367568|nr:hypothetical protein [Flavobacterium sp. 9]PIF34163.1 hypothetical protein CLU81_4798 [Flavobacterium sp. 9]
MKNLDKKIAIKKNVSSTNSTISVDKKLDKIKNVNFVSNKIEEVNKVITQIELTF